MASSLLIPPSAPAFPPEDASVCDTAPPTATIYSELETAFGHLNRALFADRLPPVAFTLRKHGRSNGYYAAARFVAIADADERVDEIAMNPTLFEKRPLKATLATITHEMVHHAQHHYGHPPKRAYHNKEWAALMKHVGLHPSDTGEPGGRETGAKVSHYVIPGGPFDVAADALIADGFVLTYTDAYEDAPRSSGGRRVKYLCTSCGLAAWSRHDAPLICGACVAVMTAVSS